MHSRALPWTATKVSIVSRLVPLLLVLLAFALRVYHLDSQSLWSDEGISLLRSSQPLGQMLAQMPVEHAPGYFLFLFFWQRVTGTSDFALRFLSLIPSVATIAVAYRLGVDLGSRWAGAIAALLLATNGFQVWYGQEARMYSWLLVFGLAATWLLRRLVTDRGLPEVPASRSAVRVSPVGRQSATINLVGYTLCVAGAVYMHHFGFLLPLAHTLFILGWLATTHNWRCFLRWMIAGCAVVLLYLPWAPHLVRVFGFPGWRSPLSPGELPWRYWTAYTVSDLMPETWHSWLPWLYALLALIGFIAWSRRSRTAGWLLLTSVIVPLVGAFALALRQPDYHERYTSFISGPAMLLIAGAGGLDIRPKALARSLMSATCWIIVAMLVAANGLALVRLYSDPLVQKADYRRAAQRIAQQEAPGDVILLDGPDPEQIFLHYYTGNLPFRDLLSLQGKSEAEVDAPLTEATTGFRRAWVLRHYHPEGAIQIWLARHAWLAAEEYYGGLYFSVYGLPELPQMDLPVVAALGSGLELTFVGLAGAVPGTEAPTVRAGDLFGISTQWRPTQPLPPLKISVRLRDRAGDFWASSDYVPQNGYAPTELWQPGQQVLDRHGLWLPPDMPPDRYTLTLVVYDPATGATIDADGAGMVELIDIGVSAASKAPDPVELQIPHRTTKAVGDAMSVLGYAIAPEPLVAGQGGRLTLWWRVDRPPSRDYEAQVTLVRGGDTAFSRTYPLAGHPATQWHAGQIVRAYYALETSPAAVAGTYAFRVRLLDVDGQLAGSASTIADISLRTRPRSYRLPRMEHSLEAQLGPAIALRGYAMALPTGSSYDNGARLLDLTLYWQASEQVRASYKVFVHVVDGRGHIVSQSDALPANGGAPTETWLRGEVISDQHTWPAPPAGRYGIEVGLYDPASGQRLTAADSAGRRLRDDAVPLGEVEIP